MTVLIHYPNVYSPPAGVWWWPADATTPASYYLPGNDAAQISGALSMTGVESGTQFAAWAQRLADSSSYAESWGIRDTDAAPILFLKALVRAAA